jgi:glutamate-1-semialdehyde 2,1-aminomutase
MDEISAGLRLTTGGAHLVISDVVPDIAVFSKGLGNGYPIAAIIGKGAVMDAAQKTFISSTYWTERIGPTAALATLKKHKAVDASKVLIELGQRIQQGWREAAERHGLPIDIGGIKPMSHFTLKIDNESLARGYFIQRMVEQGFLASNAYYAMVAHTQKHVDAYLDAVNNAFGDIKQALNAGDLQARLRGQPPAEGFKRLN